MFDQSAIFMPVLSTLLLGFFVWITLFAVRFKAIAANKVSPDQLVTPELITKALPVAANNPANNFKNLFEVPVIFFVLCFYLHATNNVDSLYVNAAWVFVAFRYIHSAIQCSYNNVGHRFLAYLVSCLTLWAMLLRAVFSAL